MEEERKKREKKKGRVEDREEEKARSRRKLRASIWNKERRDNQDEVVEAHIAAQVNKDYFVEEIRANIIFEDKIAPLLGMIAGRVGQAVLGAGKKMAQGVKQTGKWLVTPQEEEEEY